MSLQILRILTWRSNHTSRFGGEKLFLSPSRALQILRFKCYLIQKACNNFGGKENIGYPKWSRATALMHSGKDQPLAQAEYHTVCTWAGDKGGGIRANGEQKREACSDRAYSSRAQC